MSSRPLLILILSLVAGAARAEVVDAQAGGFTVRETATIAAPQAKVWAALIKPAGWWSPVHTFSHDAKNLVLEPRAGGAWMESLPNGGSARHMVVIYFDPPSTLRLEGALGPMQAMGAMGHLTFTLKPATLKPGGEATEVVMVYDLGGHAAGGMTGLAPVVDRVMGEQLAGLKSAVEAGGTP